MKKYKPSSNEIKLFSELVREKRIKLAGHILRTSEPRGPIRQVSYKPNSANTFEIGKGRAGGPRQNRLLGGPFDLVSRVNKVGYGGL